MLHRREFREGVFNSLVATSIGEEGLDIPQVRCAGLPGLTMPSAAQLLFGPQPQCSGLCFGHGKQTGGGAALPMNFAT